MSVAASTAHAPAGRSATAARAGLVLVGAAQAEIGIWGVIAPHSLFSEYPGFGHHWISALGST